MFHKDVRAVLVATTSSRERSTWSAIVTNAGSACHHGALCAAGSPRRERRPASDPLPANSPRQAAARARRPARRGAAQPRRSHRLRVRSSTATMKNWDGDPAVLAGRERRARRHDDGGESAQGEHVRHLARRRAGRLRAEARIPHERDQQRHPVPQHAAAQGADHGPNPDATIAGKWVLKGYQADIDFANQFTGMIYEERGRGIPHAARPGGRHRPDAGRGRSAISRRNADELKALIKAGEWNTIHLIARGNTHHQHRQRPRHRVCCRRRCEGAGAEGTARLPDPRRRRR